MISLTCLFVGAVFGFVLAQSRYMRWLDRAREREASYRNMLSDSHRREQETREMLAEARGGRA